jgi:hypothetical protein
MIPELSIPWFAQSGDAIKQKKTKQGQRPALKFFQLYTGRLRIVLFLEWLAIDRAAGSSSLRPGPHPRPWTAMSR